MKHTSFGNIVSHRTWTNLVGVSFLRVSTLKGSGPHTHSHQQMLGTFLRRLLLSSHGLLRKRLSALLATSSMGPHR